jgi:pyruvate kinase
VPTLLAYTTDKYGTDERVWQGRPEFCSPRRSRPPRPLKSPGVRARALKRTKIVATIGPASRDPALLRELFAAGVNVVRLNFSHGTHEEHGAVIADVRRISGELESHIAVLQDLPGPKVRTGPLANGMSAVTLVTGRPFTLTTEPIAGTADRVSVSYAGLARDVEPGKRIYLADGTIALRIESINGVAIQTRIEAGGELRPTQGINYPDGSLDIAAVTQQDLDHLAFGIEQGVDWVAVSFVRTAADIERVRAFAAERGANIPIVAKIEKHEALDDIDAIVRASDAIMVARGDLGIEVPLQQVPLIQKDLIARANRESKPVITATQMLESMIVNARPTRAEVTDVANAILDGTDAVMLSGETARGEHPLEAVRMMATIAAEVETRYPYGLQLRRRAGDELQAGDAIGRSIAEAAARSAERLDLRVIVTGTTTGNTARLISAFRPKATIFGLTPVLAVARRMNMSWGVEPLLVQPYRYLETLIEIAEQRVIAEGIADHGESIVITSGMPVGPGETNVLKIHRLP